ncbi:MAG: UDP-N-acetylglucosamine 2-epimerase [Actinobacteria bacterium]|nr:UDP-N-acetylglucosamine 2-epimerase [Thermoleophilia bacterium]MCB9011010.1 UDP-N-acetylglucosamine 2-epimerase [Actinomycetota bacterium]
MIGVVFGTTGELIKIAPLCRAIRDRSGREPLLICTGQQPEQLPDMLRAFGLRQPDVWLARGSGGRDLARAADIPGWGARVVGNAARRRGWLRRALQSDGRAPMVIVHGDTFTTVAGALMGRAMAVPVGHVEAGLRSGDWRNPFPEELNRRITSRLARVHFAPGAWAAGNLRDAGVGGEIVDTGANTIADSLALVTATPEIDLPDPPFGVVSIHRFELLRDQARLRAVLEAIRDGARRTPLLFVDHPVTCDALTAQGLDGLLDGEGITRIPRQGYGSFIGLLTRSAFLLTDSGGCQEEAAVLGHPTLIHRARTERRDGLDGGPVVLSHLDLDEVRRFLDGGWEASRRSGVRPGESPTGVIERWLVTHGHLAEHDAAPGGR